MEFCLKCGSILTKKAGGIGCSKCSYVAKGKVDMEMKEDVDEGSEVIVVSKSEGVYPVTDWNCFKCGSKKAEFWMRQMRRGDEPESKFYRCVKCGKTVRVDD